MKSKGYENYLIDYQRKNALILIEILPTILKRNVWRSVWRICVSILGLKGLSNKDGNGSENVTQEKRTRADSNFITLMPTLLICQVLVIFSGAEF